MPKSEWDRVFTETGGDLRQIEIKLGLNTGQLSNSDTLVALIDKDNFSGLRMATGNEGGASDLFWRPGGYTSGDVIEGVMDFSSKPPFTEIPL